MSKFMQILVVALSLSAIFAWAAIAYLWSDQQRLIALTTELTQNKSVKSTPTSTELIDQTLVTISGLDERVTKLELASGSGLQQKVVTITQTSPIKIGANEYFVPMGAGKTDDTAWIDLNGTAVWVDTNKYGEIKAVYFEGGLSIIGGEVHARLKNKSTGAILAISEITNNTQSAMSQTSAPFQLHPGNNEYVVQLRSSSKEWANIEGSRIRIVVQ